ncbi:MAG: hypothetical protein OXC40_07205, partial [Proteobacteria bacterium]|nr:hypothetical protein [Pseudomonadota bacterium]
GGGCGLKIKLTEDKKESCYDKLNIEKGKEKINFFSDKKAKIRSQHYVTGLVLKHQIYVPEKVEEKRFKNLHSNGIEYAGWKLTKEKPLLLISRLTKMDRIFEIHPLARDYGDRYHGGDSHILLKTIGPDLELVDVSRMSYKFALFHDSYDPRIFVFRRFEEVQLCHKKCRKLYQNLMDQQKSPKSGKIAYAEVKKLNDPFDDIRAKNNDAFQVTGGLNTLLENNWPGQEKFPYFPWKHPSIENPNGRMHERALDWTNHPGKPANQLYGLNKLIYKASEDKLRRLFVTPVNMNLLSVHVKGDEEPLIIKNKRKVKKSIYLKTFNANKKYLRNVPLLTNLIHDYDEVKTENKVNEKDILIARKLGSSKIVLIIADLKDNECGKDNGQ